MCNPKYQSGPVGGIYETRDRGVVLERAKAAVVFTTTPFVVLPSAHRVGGPGRQGGRVVDAVLRQLATRAQRARCAAKLFT